MDSIKKITRKMDKKQLPLYYKNEIGRVERELLSANVEWSALKIKQYKTPAEQAREVELNIAIIIGTEYARALRKREKNL